MLEGFRREVAVNELCRREGIKPGAYYAWTKDFIEAGKERLTRDTEKQLLSVATEATRFGKPEKTVEPDYSRRGRRSTGGSPGVS